MRWFRFAILLALATILQAGLKNWSYKPDLLLIMLVFFSVFTGLRNAILISFTIGLAADLIGFAVGPSIIAFGILGTLLAKLTDFISIRKIPYQVITIFITGAIVGFMIYSLNLMKGLSSNPAIYKSVFSTAAYSAVVGPFLFWPFAWWMQIRISSFRKR